MKEEEPKYRNHSAMLWLAEIIESETNLSWDSSKKIAQRLLDEISSIPELFETK